MFGVPKVAALCATTLLLAVWARPEPSAGPAPGPRAEVGTVVGAKETVWA